MNTKETYRYTFKDWEERRFKFTPNSALDLSREDWLKITKEQKKIFEEYVECAKNELIGLFRSKINNSQDKETLLLNELTLLQEIFHGEEEKTKFIYDVVGGVWGRDIFNSIKKIYYQQIVQGNIEYSSIATPNEDLNFSIKSESIQHDLNLQILAFSYFRYWKFLEKIKGSGNFELLHHFNKKEEKKSNLLWLKNEEGLEKLHKLLIEHRFINELSLMDFNRHFKGEIIENKINWLETRYCCFWFFNKLSEKGLIDCRFENKYAQTISQHFIFKGVVVKAESLYSLISKGKLKESVGKKMMLIISSL
ncbi:hypothetical protein [Solitalea koreensis]|uniref:Uncharacterized protein n=1 Tax=Solitalea koreensis TaxID=543615 RepID=A0A521DL62_9SPHI|nr:hypothetical protein [Solitalea koreensis]SMO72322.1 hypothetical protein SAMN06265350_107104 [Solitalea koreensis]